MLSLRELGQEKSTREFLIRERLPSFLTSPCHLSVDYYAEKRDQVFLLHLQLCGELTVICQRCMEEFPYHYEQKIVLAVCRDEERAEQLMEHYETVVAQEDVVNLEELVVDELHLSAPQFHQEMSDCGHDVNQILVRK